MGVLIWRAAALTAGRIAFTSESPPVEEMASKRSCRAVFALYELSEIAQRDLNEARSVLLMLKRRMMMLIWASVSVSFMPTTESTSRSCLSFASRVFFLLSDETGDRFG